MATRRMLSAEIIGSDAFLDLPQTAQLLYFHLSLAVDDDGFLSGAKRIARIIGAADADFAALVDNGFLIEFPESKTFCVTHHRIHNRIQSDRYHPTVYQKEFAQLELTENKEWRKKKTGSQTDPLCVQSVSETDPSCVHPVSGMEPEYSIGESSIGESSAGKGSLEGKTGNELKLLLAMAQNDGIADEVREAASLYGYGVCYSAWRSWKDNGRNGKFDDFVKQILKGEN